jgi:hypothetical protein
MSNIKDDYIHIRVSKKQKEDIINLSSKNNMSITSYIWMLILRDRSRKVYK